MNHSKKLLLILVFIVIIGAFLRFFNLNEYPISLNWDEATFAYNAYSILETGKDEYGENYPLIFKSIGDYKNPLLVYTMVPFIKVFGLNEFAIRLPTAFFATLSIVLIFLIAKILSKNVYIALSAAFYLAISSWHLQFSRAGLEPPISLFLILCAVLTFLYALKKNARYLYLTALFFGINLYSYYADRFFIPLIILALAIIFWKDLIKNKRQLLLPIIFGFIIILPLLVPFFSSGSQSKILNTTLLGYRPTDEYIDQIKKEDQNSLNFFVFHNNFIQYSKLISERYLNHFSPGYLFFIGADDNRQTIYGMGIMYLFELPLLIFGGYTLFRRRDKYSLFIFSWLLLAPLPAAITRDEFHPRRAFQMVAPLAIIGGFGLYSLWSALVDYKSKIKYFFAGVFLLLAISNVCYYLVSYYVFTPVRTFKGSAGWQYGYKQLVEKISPLKNNYEHIIIDTSYQGPYIYFLFYEKYPPARYQPQAKLVYECPTCLGEGAGYDNYTFRPIFWPGDRGSKKTLFAGPPERIPEKDIEAGKARIIDRIYFPDGEVAFLIVETL